MSIHISPSILGADFYCLKECIKETESAGADSIHFDIMDRHFVPNLSFGPMLLKHLRPHTNLPFKVHLMTENPDLYIDECIEYGASLITVHKEACIHLHRTLGYIKQKGAKAGIAVNPSTGISFLPYVADMIDELLVMTVNPGFSGQKTIPLVLNKIDEAYLKAKELGIHISINVDGGMDINTSRQAIAKGADSIVMASAFYSIENKKSIIEEIKSMPIRKP